MELSTFSGKNRSFLHFEDDGLSSDAEVAHDFFLELATPTKLRIKSSQVPKQGVKTIILGLGG